MARKSVLDMEANILYEALLNKSLKKKRSKEEVDQIICWLTGYSTPKLQQQLKRKISYQTFFEEAPSPNPLRHKITGKICGVSINEIEDRWMKEVRYLDKLIDELAKGRPLDKILKR